MSVTLGPHDEPAAELPSRAAQSSKRAERREFSAAFAIALYFAGALVESLGLGLIAAYGWVLAGGAIAGFGLVVGTIGNGGWPAQGVSNVALLMGYADVAKRRRSVADGNTTPGPVVTAGVGNKSGRR